MKKKHLDLIKIALKVTTLIIAVWALIIAYQASNKADWVDSKQDNVIEVLLKMDK